MIKNIIGELKKELTAFHLTESTEYISPTPVTVAMINAI